MITILSAVVSMRGFRLRRRAFLELELIALRNQVSLRRQRPGRLRLFSTVRLLWMWLYRVWPQVLSATVLVKPPWPSGIAKAFGHTGGGDHASGTAQDEYRNP
jgi:hypothetical protein